MALGLFQGCDASEQSKAAPCASITLQLVGGGCFRKSLERPLIFTRLGSRGMRIICMPESMLERSLKSSMVEQYPWMRKAWLRKRTQNRYLLSLCLPSGVRYRCWQSRPKDEHSVGCGAERINLVPADLLDR